MDAILKIEIKAWRQQVSEEYETDLWRIMKNSVIDELVIHKPTSVASLKVLKLVLHIFLQYEKYNKINLNICSVQIFWSTEN